MQKLEDAILQLKCSSEVAAKIKKRIRTFASYRKKNCAELFKEFCFCILTANYTAEGGIRIQKAIGNGFLTLSQAALARKLKKLHYRFPNMRARYICEARHYLPFLKFLFNFSSSKEAREWLVKNVLGIGYKEASHFLRNIGFNDVAIIDFHIINILMQNKIIKKPKSRSLSKKTYFEIEKKLEKLARKTKISLAELDLYLWYLETGKVLK